MQYVDSIYKKGSMAVIYRASFNRMKKNKYANDNKMYIAIRSDSSFFLYNMIKPNTNNMGSNIILYVIKLLNCFEAGSNCVHFSTVLYCS